MDKLFDDIEDAFASFGWENVLEIAFITLVVFWLLRLVRGTTAMTVIHGISIIAVVVVVLSRTLDSVVLDWIVNNAIAVIVVFVLIVFQPEFRRALERIGRAGGVRAWAGIGRDPGIEAVRAISHACAVLAERRSGALIVIERETGLQDVVDTGIVLNAEVSVALIESIFYPNAPFHDGAVVVHENHLLAASCILPSSAERPAGLEYLGTRHRAATGMSEQTDAIVVAISEETGAISIASDGRLVRVQDSEELEAALVRLVQGSGRGGGGADRDGSRTITVAGS